MKFGGGKVIRDGMGQGQARSVAVDCVITNALILTTGGSSRRILASRPGASLVLAKPEIRMSSPA